jgi:hypothetical protein
MRFSPLILLAQAAVMTTAFLIPPEFSEDQLKELMMPIDIGAGLALSKMSMSRIIRIPCEGCPVKEEGVSTDLVSTLCSIAASGESSEHATSDQRAASCDMRTNSSA